MLGTIQMYVNYLCFIEILDIILLCVKEKKTFCTAQKCKSKRALYVIPKYLSINTPRLVDMPLKLVIQAIKQS